MSICNCQYLFLVDKKAPSYLSFPSAQTHFLPNLLEPPNVFQNFIKKSFIFLFNGTISNFIIIQYQSLCIPSSKSFNMFQFLQYFINLLIENTRAKSLPPPKMSTHLHNLSFFYLKFHLIINSQKFTKTFAQTLTKFTCFVFFFPIWNSPCHIQVYTCTYVYFLCWSNVVCKYPYAI